jgi:hypothetical protein
VFSKNRDRLLGGDIAAKFLAAVLAQPKLLFSVDGTLGLDEERQAQVGRAASARRRAQCRSGLPWSETLERRPCDPDPDARVYREKTRRRSCASSGTG